MVKSVVAFILFFTLAISDEVALVEEDLLSQKIKSFVGIEEYTQNLNFINIIFDPKSSFYINDRVDIIKVVKTLEDNGLLKLFFKTPKEINLKFKTSGFPLFFVKLMGDSLKNIGYYRYMTTASTLDSSEFSWSITLNTEYATDPLILQAELNKSGCSITDIERTSATDWIYVVDMSNGFLDLPILEHEVTLKLKNTLYAHWLDCSSVQSVKVKSSSRNNWYPYIAYYDSSLHLLQVIKQDYKTFQVVLDIPKRAKYMKISDLYSLKNVKDSLSISPYGRR